MKKIIVYSTPTCPYCTMVKDHLKSKKLDFEDKNIALDRVAAQEMLDRTQQMGVPVTMIDDRYVIGYDPSKIDKLLEADS